MRGLLGFLVAVGCATAATLTCEHDKAVLRELLESQRVGFEQEKAQMAAGFAKLLKRSADDATPPRTADLARLIAPQGPQAAEGRLGKGTDAPGIGPQAVRSNAAQSLQDKASPEEPMALKRLLREAQTGESPTVTTEEKAIRQELGENKRTSLLLGEGSRMALLSSLHAKGTPEEKKALDALLVKADDTLDRLHEAVSARRGEASTDRAVDPGAPARSALTYPLPCSRPAMALPTRLQPWMEALVLGFHLTSAPPSPSNWMPQVRKYPDQRHSVRRNEESHVQAALRNKEVPHW